MYVQLNRAHLRLCSLTVPGGGAAAPRLLLLQLRLLLLLPLLLLPLLVSPGSNEPLLHVERHLMLQGLPE